MVTELQEIISKTVCSLPLYDMEAMGIGQQALLLDALLETLPLAIRKFDDLQKTVARARKEKAVLDDQVCCWFLGMISLGLQCEVSTYIVVHRPMTQRLQASLGSLRPP
jgi:hypothetical protein